MMSFAVFFFTTLVGIHMYVGWRLTRYSTSSAAGKWAICLALACMTALIFITFIGGRWEKRPSHFNLVQWAGYISLGFILSVFPVLLIRDLVWLVFRGASLLGYQLGAAPQSAVTDVESSRRLFLLHASNMAAVGVGAWVSSVGVAQARRTPNVKKITIPLQRLPQAFDGFTICQISDLHVGPTIKRPFVEAVVEQALALDADLIAVTGDLVDGYINDLEHDVTPLANLRAREGVFYVTGNHEYYWDGPGWVEKVKTLGMKPLLNQHAVIHRDGQDLVVAGVTDISGGEHVPGHRSDPAAAVRSAPDGAPAIMLAHQPRSLHAVRKESVDLQLSGHTHGGQFFPWNFFIYFVQPVVAGLKAFGSLKVYVNRGTGYWGPPTRAGSPSEITLITLRPESESSS